MSSSSSRSPRASPRSSPRPERRTRFPDTNSHSPKSPHQGFLQAHPPPLALQVHRQVEEITDILKDNVRGLVEREGKLEELADRAKNISETSKLFEKTTHKVQETFWKRNKKLTIILCVVSLLLVIAIGGILFQTLH